MTDGDIWELYGEAWDKMPDDIEDPNATTADEWLTKHYMDTLGLDEAGAKGHLLAERARFAGARPKRERGA